MIPNTPETATPADAPPVVAPEDAQAPVAHPAEPVAPGKKQPIERTRLSATYKGLVGGAVILVLLLVFILENTQKVNVTYFGASGHLPLGVALLLAAVAGALLVGVVGIGRILQLRRRINSRR